MRTTVGVSERVDLSSDGDTWSMNGAGTLNTTSGSDVRLTAADTAGTAIVSVSGANCMMASLRYNVIAPSGLLYVATGGVKHTMGLSDIGMKTEFYLQPDNVSFSNLSFLELDAASVATGPWACGNGLGHNPNPASLRVGDNVPGLGSPVLGTDEAFIGSCAGANQLAAGSDSITIPDVYVGLGGARNTFGSTQQIASANGSGNLSMRKGAAVRTTTVNSPTSNY